jgi:hypothetical protein
MGKFAAMWVIFAGSPLGGPGTRYIATDGSVTNSKSRAAKFYTPEGAFDFATRQGIVLNGATRYVSQDTFTETELERRSLAS